MQRPIAILKIILIFILSMILFSSFWIINNYGSNATLETIIFHLNMPLDGASAQFYISYFINVFLASSFLTLLFHFKPRTTLALILAFCAISYVLDLDEISSTLNNARLYIIKIYYESFLYTQSFSFALIIKIIALLLLILIAFTFIYKIFKNLKARLINTKFLNDKRVLNIASFCIIFIFAISSFRVIDKHFMIISFLKPKEYSNFLEQNYITLESINKSNKQKNLILIIAESMESTYANTTNNKMGGGSQKFRF